MFKDDNVNDGAFKYSRMLRKEKKKDGSIGSIFLHSDLWNFKTTHFLSGCVPDIEFDRTAVGVEVQGMHLHPQSCNVFLFKFSRQVTFHERCFTDTTISDKNQFKFRCSLQRKKIDTSNKYKYK